MPQEWAAAAAGADVVIGARAAAWAPCPELATVVVVDEHDEALQEERSPTWHARDVAVERARRAGVPVLLVSPCPTVIGLAAVGGHLDRPAVDDERAGWPFVEVVDRSRDEPWKTSLVTSPLIGHLRDAGKVVVCVHNTPGRARILACRNCRTLARCAVCDAAVGMADDETFACRRCGTVRPAVCLHCGAAAFANLRPGVTRLREELEAAAGRPVVAVTGGDDGPAAERRGLRGHRSGPAPRPRADVVAFLDLDAELLAPRYRAAEQAMALLVRGARLVGRRADGGRLLVQTFLPRHEVVQAALLADPGRLVEPERARRRLLDLPPFGALAAISGAGSDEVADALRGVDGIAVGGDAGRFVVRAPTWESLGRGDHLRAPPQGLPPPRRGRPTPPVTSLHPSICAIRVFGMRARPSRRTPVRSLSLPGCLGTPMRTGRFGMELPFNVVGRHRRRWALVAVTTLAMGVASCGDDDDDDAVTSTTTVETAAASTTTPAPTTVPPTTAPPTTPAPTAPPSTTVEQLEAQVAADVLRSWQLRDELLANPTLENLDARIAEMSAPGHPASAVDQDDRSRSTSSSGQRLVRTDPDAGLDPGARRHASRAREPYTSGTGTNLRPSTTANSSTPRAKSSASRCLPLAIPGERARREDRARVAAGRTRSPITWEEEGVLSCPPD